MRVCHQALPPPPCQSGSCLHPGIRALAPAQVPPTSALAFGTAGTRALEPGPPETPMSPKSHFLGPQTFHPGGQFSPLPAPPFLQVYSPYLWGP